MMLIVVMSLILWIYSVDASYCTNPKGQPVDWFIIYKLPKLHHIQDSTGTEQMYIDSEDSGGWRRLEQDVTASDGHPLADTLNQIHKDTSINMYAMYNDEVPCSPDQGGQGTRLEDAIRGSRGRENGVECGENTTKAGNFIGGHTKGVIHFNTSRGFWLVHSVPLFPSQPYPYLYPHTGLMYGQSALCVTLPYSQLDDIGKQLTFNQPSIYKSVLPKVIESQNPNLASALSGKFTHKEPFTSVVKLKSSKGQEFVSFAKKGGFHKDLYSDLVAPTLNSDLMVECWRNGGGNLPSSCVKGKKVENVLEVKIGGLSFNTTHDHSKWVISNLQGRMKGSQKHYVCVGDINRQHGQLVRGGGTLCFDHFKVWKAFKGIILLKEACPKKKTPPTNYIFNKIRWKPLLKTKKISMHVLSLDINMKSFNYIFKNEIPSIKPRYIFMRQLWNTNLRVRVRVFSFDWCVFITLLILNTVFVYSCACWCCKKERVKHRGGKDAWVEGVEGRDFDDGGVESRVWGEKFGEGICDGGRRGDGNGSSGGIDGGGEKYGGICGDGGGGIYKYAKLNNNKAYINV